MHRTSKIVIDAVLQLHVAMTRQGVHVWENIFDVSSNRLVEYYKIIKIISSFTQIFGPQKITAAVVRRAADDEHTLRMRVGDEMAHNYNKYKIHQ